MTYTNTKHWPQIFLDAATPGIPYIPMWESDYSATSLIDSPRIFQLRKRHRAEVTEDVSDHFKSFLGDAIHKQLDSSLRLKGYATERKFFQCVEGRNIVCRIDAYKDGILWDHKTTTANNVMRGIKQEWEEQLNINAWFLAKSGIPVSSIRIHAVILDWNKWDLLRRKDYPATPVLELMIPLWDFERQDAFVRSLVAAHKAAENLPDDELPLCTLKDRWRNGDVYAVRLPNVGTSKRNCSSEEEAKAFIDDKSLHAAYIEYRPGTDIRCEDYCMGAAFCNQYKANKEEKENSCGKKTKGKNSEIPF